jgi:hypothetical protein
LRADLLCPSSSGTSSGLVGVEQPVAASAAASLASLQQEHGLAPAAASPSASATMAVEQVCACPSPTNTH